MTQETLLASVFAQGRYCGAILSRGVMGYEAIDETGKSHGCFPSQRDAAAAAALQQMAACPGDASIGIVA
jgi:hypothetical protein